MNAGIRRGRQQFMGMDVLILHTAGRRSGEPRESPGSWIHDPADNEARLIVASGGGRYDPGWHVNLMAHPGQASIELPGGTSMPVTPHELDGAERDQAWARITAEQPRFAKYQQKTPDREDPVIRLTPWTTAPHSPGSRCRARIWPRCAASQPAAGERRREAAQPVLRSRLPGQSFPLLAGRA